jgi:hypothetical protein
MVDIEPDFQTVWSGARNWMRANVVPLLFVGGAFCLGAACGAWL